MKIFLILFTGFVSALFLGFNSPPEIKMQAGYRISQFANHEAFSDTIPPKKYLEIRSAEFSNETGYPLEIYVNGSYVGHLDPYAPPKTFYLFIDKRTHLAKIDAISTGGTQTWQYSSTQTSFSAPRFTITNDGLQLNPDGGKPIKVDQSGTKPINLSVIKSVKTESAGDSMPASLKLFDYRKAREISSGIVYEHDSVAVIIHFNKPETRKYLYAVIYSTPANKSSLIFPNEFSSKESNFFPPQDSLGKPVIDHILVNIEVIPPLGKDTYVLIGADDPIQDLSVFNDFNEVMLLLKGSPLSLFHDLLRGGYYINTLTVEARPARERNGFEATFIVNTKGFDGGKNNIPFYKDSTGIYYDPNGRDTLKRELFPFVDFIEPEFETMKGGKVLNSKDANKIMIKGIAVDKLCGIKSISINHEPPGNYRPVSGYFDYQYTLVPGENRVNILVENNNGYRREYRTDFEYEPQKNDISSPSRNYLLIIAINNYKNWNSLNNAVKDANDFKNLMISQFGYTEENVMELYDTAATRENIISQFESFAANISSNDNLLIYYSGHGAYNKNIELGYWVPAEARLNNVSAYLENVLIARYIRAIKAKKTFLISDACYSGSLLEETKRGDKDFSEKVKDYKARIVLASGRLEEVSDGAPGTNSPFASQLLSFLRNSKEKEILASDLINFVKKSVGNNAKQTPTGGVLMDTGDEGGEFIFLRK